MIGDTIKLIVEAKCINGPSYTGKMTANFTVGNADFFEGEEDKLAFDKSIGSVSGVLGGRGGIQISQRDGDTWQIDAPTIWLAFQEALQHLAPVPEEGVCQ